MYELSGKRETNMSWVVRCGCAATPVQCQCQGRDKNRHGAFNCTFRRYRALHHRNVIQQMHCLVELQNSLNQFTITPSPSRHQVFIYLSITMSTHHIISFTLLIDSFPTTHTSPNANRTVFYSNHIILAVIC